MNGQPARRGRNARTASHGFVQQSVLLRLMVMAAVILIGIAFALAVRRHLKQLDAGRMARLAETVAASTPVESEAVSQAASAPSDESHALAACHPHLVHAPDGVPLIDTSGVPAPNLAHIKIHFWVNGGGLVVRSQLVSADMGTLIEQQAEVAYVRELHFDVPDTGDCRQREMELVGDFFQAPTTAGEWMTLVRVYPHLQLNAQGNVRIVD